jgi:molybdopterin synthase sulfur carrier subunit
MKNPNPINLQTSEEIRKAGWQGETRDSDGHLCRTHVPFDTDEEILWFVREALEFGETVTIWPLSPSDAGHPVGANLHE